MLQRMATLFWAFGLIACATGPHPALAPASKTLECDPKQLTLHEIFRSKVRVEGCGREVTYVKVCKGYGADASCGWAFKPD